MYGIRKYKSSDKERLRYICKETTSENNKKNKAKLECIPIIFNDYFTENEPENIFVAVDDNDTAIGYVICCTQYPLFKNKVLNDLTKRIIKIHTPSIIMLLASYFSVLITKKQYRVHLHIDILPYAQRMGVGTKLINSLCEHLKSKNIKNVSVIGINKRSLGYKFYTRYGFRTVKNYPLNILTMTYDIK